jgi:NhaA family Na+:H+ antiporter
VTSHLSTEPTHPEPSDTARFPSIGTYSEVLRIGAILRKETVGGALLVIFAVVGIAWANSPWAESYTALRDLRIGYEPWHLDLSLGAWAADGLLAIFFFLVGLDLRRPATAVVPVMAAVGGVAVPAVLYMTIAGHRPGLADGWAIPTATDIAFAVAVLAIIGSHLPTPLRIFLLTLAVVDDLIAITIIAMFYTDSISLLPLGIGLGLGAIACYGVVAQRFRELFRVRPSAAWFVLLPVGAVAWAFVHASGIHATIAGVLLGFTIPVLPHRTARPTSGARTPSPTSGPGLAEVFEHRFRPLSAGLAVPVFAFLSAGVTIGGADGPRSALADPVTIGIVAALVVGKPAGILCATWAATRVRSIRLDPQLAWVDIAGVGLLAGIGFTVSLLVTELSFDPGSPEHDHAKIAILLASVLAAALASILLTVRDRHYRRLRTVAERDDDGDGVPDIHQDDG